MSRPPLDPECLGLHVPTPRADAIRVDWAKSLPRADRLRVRGHTCACTYPAFELCTAAGLWFVRRLPAKGLGDIVESAWTSASATEELWLQIVTGRAR